MDRRRSAGLRALVVAGQAALRMIVEHRQDRIASVQPSPHDLATAPQNDFAEQFLMTEYEHIRELRASTLGLVEGRIKFILTLQTAEVAFIGLLITSKSLSGTVIATVALVLGAPTLLLTYLVYLRALDFQIMGRRYFRAINAIRGYFAARYPHIRPALLMPTDPRLPKMSSVGEGSSVLLSFAVTMLIITMILLITLASVATWLLLHQVTKSSSRTAIMAAITAGVCLGLVIGLMQMRYIKRRLDQAERND